MKNYIVKINRTGKKLYFNKNKYVMARDILEEAGYIRVDPLDILNKYEIKWEGVEFNSMFAKDNVLYRFNGWITFGKSIPEYPYNGIEIEEIGTIWVE